MWVAGFQFIYAQRHWTQRHGSFLFEASRQRGALQSKDMNDANLLSTAASNLQLRHFVTTPCLSVELKGAHIAAMRVIEALDPPCEYITGALLLCCYLCRCCRCTARSIHPRGCGNKPTLLVRLTTTHNPNLHPFAGSGARAGRGHCRSATALVNVLERSRECPYPLNR